MKILICISLLLSPIATFAHGGGDDGGTQIGPDKGITEKGPLGLKLSAEAMKTIGFQFADAKGNTIEIPANALVKMREEKSIFIMRDSWFKRVDVVVLQKNDKTITVSSKDLKVGDKVVVTQIGYLGVIEVYAGSGEEHEEEAEEAAKDKHTGEKKDKHEHSENEKEGDHDD